ncbi:Chaperone protein HscA [Corynebacterium kalinowskii]|uniref:Chaperone protein HscA n=1 Tax=Corynebacterium kalinowskii TaxID=2675216 RepID=A0A6B8VPB7_9CORY|nr:Hsp70 family protein [Corynebacterium kalinowskii]QGU01397.1 Chaperone protein HscA [Corynebacterium kalinowskii]
MSQEWHFAIDFGTSNTSAAHTAPLSGAVETVALTHRSNLMPSAVYVEGDKVLAGDTALLRGRRDASKLLLSPKRYIDHDQVQLAGSDADTRLLVASVIKAALERARTQHAGTDPATVTLTHPEAWSVHSVDQLKRAAEKAGVRPEQIRTISEPRAAAIHYASQQRIEEGRHVAVFDFGGGTLDIAVLQSQADGNFKVVSAKGDNSLGGRTVDNLMFRWVIAQLEHDDPDFADYVRTAPVSVMHSLEEAIRESKELLSDTSSSTISVSTPQGERDVLITRDEFNGIIQDAVSRAVELTQAALQQAGVDEATTPIYMTGGSSRIPYVQNRLGEIGTVMTLDDPKTVVSRGALRATLSGFTAGSAGTPSIAPASPFGAAASAPQTMNQEAPAPQAEANPYGANPYAAGAPQADVNPYNNAPQTTGTREFAAAPMAGQPMASTSAATKNGSGKTLLFAVLGVVVAGAIAAAVIVNFMGGKDSGTGAQTGGETSTAPSTSSAPKTTAAAAPKPAVNDPGQTDPTKSERHISNREPSTFGVLPAEFTDKIRSCLDKRSGQYGTSWVEGTSAQHYACLMEYSALGDKEKELAYNGSKYIFVGADAETAYNDMKKNAKVKAEKIQDSSADKPEINIGLEGAQDSSPDWMAYYPHDKILVTSHTGTDFRGKENEYLKFFGFM